MPDKKNEVTVSSKRLSELIYKEDLLADLVFDYMSDWMVTTPEEYYSTVEQLTENFIVRLDDDEKVDEAILKLCLKLDSLLDHDLYTVKIIQKLIKSLSFSDTSKAKELRKELLKNTKKLRKAVEKEDY